MRATGYYRLASRRLVLLAAVMMAASGLSAAQPADRGSAGIDAIVQERLTPLQLEAFLAGTDPAMIVLDDGTTLDDFLLEGLIETSADSTYHALNQCLVVRTATAPGGAKLEAHVAKKYRVRGPTRSLSFQGGSAAGCGVPVDATAVVLNVKVYSAPSSGQVSVYPLGHTSTPAVVNIQPAETVNNMVTVAMGSTGDFAVKPSVRVHLVIHTVGYFSPALGGAGSLRDVADAICGLYELATLTLPAFCPRTVFVTSGTYTGDLVAEANALTGYAGSDGLEAGDEICNHLANAAGLDGTYVAWLSSSTVNAKDRLAATGSPWNRVDGSLVANDLAQLLSCSGTPGDPCLHNPINRDESGLVSSGGVFGGVWTGTRRSGTADANTCLSWTTGSSAEIGKIGSVNRSDLNWTGLAINHFCHIGFPLYCFGQ